jgi:hypothetical protein
MTKSSTPMEIAERELRLFLSDRLTNRAVYPHEVEILAKLREALELIREVRFGLAQDDLRPDRSVFLRATTKH